ncbi:MAG: efflux RND transporter periplasmic adaptor subunit [Acidobacteriota bacterium]
MRGRRRVGRRRRRWMPAPAALLPLGALVLFAVACGRDPASSSSPPAQDRAAPRGEAHTPASAAGHTGPASGHRPGMPPGAGGPSAGKEPDTLAAVPVQTAEVTQQSIANYIETNGTLEAEYEIDIVARTTGPVVELAAEEGDRVHEGDLLARLDDKELRTQLEVTRVDLHEARLAFERARNLQKNALISSESFDQSESALEAAQAQFDGSTVQLGYTEIRAPFDGLIVRRYVDFAQHVATGDALFRLSDFTPLLCPIQVPERELRRLHAQQPAHLTVEAFPGESFSASVLRISPIVEAATGTIKVTLEVVSKNRLRPGMFARVFLETDRRDDALVIPRSALSLDSISDTVYVATSGVAERRDVELGYSEGDLVEVVDGLAEGEQVVVVGQDGLTDGTPIRVLTGDDENGSTSKAAGPGQRLAGGPGHDPGAARPPLAGRGRFDLGHATPEQLERVKKMMRDRGMTDDQIEARLARAREGAGAASR